MQHHVTHTHTPSPCFHWLLKETHQIHRTPHIPQVRIPFPPSHQSSLNTNLKPTDRKTDTPTQQHRDTDDMQVPPQHNCLSHTLHGTAIYANQLAPQTTPTDRQSYDSPMCRVWVLDCRSLLMSWPHTLTRVGVVVRVKLLAVKQNAFD